MSCVGPKWEFELLIREHLRTRCISHPRLVSEYVFDDTRDWRFDWALPTLALAFEYEGIYAKRPGQSGKSRHLTPTGYSNDCEKYTRANIAGWTLVRCTPIMLSDGRAGPLIRDAIDQQLKAASNHP